MLNVHPSLLPRWRGAAPIERAIMAGDAETGVAIMRLTAGLDSGPVCLVEREPIRPEDTYGTLSARLAPLGGDLLLRALDERPPFVEQAEDGVDLRGEDRRRGSDARPARAAAAELERDRPRAHARTSAPAWRCADGSFLGVWGARLADRRRAQPGTLGNEGGRLLLVLRATARPSSSRSSNPPGEAPDARRRLPARPRP